MKIDETQIELENANRIEQEEKAEERRDTERFRKLYEDRSVLLPRVKEVTYADDGLKPSISVIVPIFNADYTLEQALASLERQTFDDIEIICVNDASPDKSTDIIERHMEGDKRYVLVEHGENSGYGASMNDGISVARGEWIAILEPDDYMFPRMFDSLMSLRDSYSDCTVDVIKSPYVREIRAEGVKRGDSPLGTQNCSYRYRIKPTKQPFDMTDPSASHLLRHHPSIWSAIYRRDFLIDSEIFFVEYPGAGWADNEFFYETLLQAKNILYTDVPYYVYREETDDEYDAFARKNKSLPFDRWNAMADIIERLGITDEHILRSHVAKGFTYLSGQLKAIGDDDQIIREEMDRMFSRMDKDIVDVEEKINPGLKMRFYESRDADVDEKALKLNYLKNLAGEFVYTMRNNGIGYTMKQVKKTLGR